jgi:hypothetical protein
MTLKPCFYYLLVRLFDPSNLKSNGKKVIELPDAVRQQQMEDFPHGIVEAVGPECKTFKIGDKVLFLPSNCIGLEEGNPLRLVPESAVFAHYIEDDVQV